MTEERLMYPDAHSAHEESLAIQASAGDLHAFDELTKSWNRRIYNFALRYLGDHDEAMEASQQTFIKAWKGISGLKEGAQFRAWLYIIAGNTCRDTLRKASRSRTESLDAEGEHHEAHSLYMQPGDKLVQQDRTKLLRQALAKLPEEQRVVLILKEYEGLKFREIARILDIPEGTVKSRLYYGLNAMRKLLQLYKHEER